MSNAVNKFIDHMREFDCEPHSADDVIADDTRRYFRLAGDKPTVKKGSYVLRVDSDGFACGWCMNMRDGVLHSYTSKSSRKATPEEKAAWQKKRDDDKAARIEAERIERERAAAVSVKMWNEATEDGVAAFPYVMRKQMTGEGLRVWTDLERFDDWLLVPVLSSDGSIVGMQKISADGDKLFVPGSAVGGGAFWIGAPDDGGVVALCEGVATGDAIRKATGWTVCVCFNAGNLLDVARRFPARGARVVVCADNDLWTWSHKHRKHRPDVLPDHDAPEWITWRDAGWLDNVGRDKAGQAAAILGGAQVLYPVGGGDWNDVLVAEGIDTVKAGLLPPVEMVREWEPMNDDWPEPNEIGPIPDDLPIDRIKREVRPQGYIGKKYYFFPRSTGDIEEMSTSDLRSDLNLYHLARESFWHSFFDDPSKATGKDVVGMMSPRLMEMCKDKGKFDPERVLSTGVWPDGKGGVVANMGNTLYIPSVGFMDHTEYESDKVYISAPKSVDLNVEPLLNAEAVVLRKICEGLSWRYKISGSLLAGWIYASILSGALRWRPHIFVTGPKGSGKTTVMRDIIKAILKGWSTNADGGTTSAGFRRKLGNQARPVVSDEMETETIKQRANADDVLMLARQSSSGAEYSNAYVDITVHSCFCFGGINPNIKNGADKDRITEMELVKDKSEGFRARWKERESEIKTVISGNFGRRLARRAIDNAGAFLANLEVFEDELSSILGDSRSAEQFAPMIAGLYGLHSTGRITHEQAKEWVGKQDWNFFHDEDEGSDAEKMVSHLLTAMAEFTVADKTNRVAISDLLRIAMDDGHGSDAAKLSLGRYGLKVDSGWLVVANSKSRIGELMKDTSWTVPKNTLSRYPGAESVGVTRFAPGVVSRGIKIPLAGLVDGVVLEEELPLYADDMEGFK